MRSLPPPFHSHSSQLSHSTQPPKHPPQLGKQPMKRRSIHHNLQHRIGKTHVARVDQLPGAAIFVDGVRFVVVVVVEAAATADLA